MELAGKKIRRQLQFSTEGGLELAAFHRDVLANFKLAFGVFISGDVALAQKLLDEKERLRLAELGAAESHFSRLRAGRVESIETSSLHLDVLRDLRRVHSHICSVAYSTLEASGQLHRQQVNFDQPERIRVPECATPRVGAARSIS
jgi:phosphate:Na+ symporter